jgi:hypothetical protein
VRMPRTVEENARTALRELEFIKLLGQYLTKAFDANIVSQPKIGEARPDFLMTFPSGNVALVEAKGTTPNTQARLDQSVRKLNRYADIYEQEFPDKRRPDLLLAVPGTFSPQHLDFILASGVSGVIDGPTLRAAGVDPEYIGGLAEATEAQPLSLRTRAVELLERLDAVKPGRAEWSIYQTLCGDMLDFLLCPPLSSPLGELPNSAKVNRRDFVLPNYATTGFWEYMRAYYAGHYIVVDAKNYTGNVKKGEVLQLANYLSAHGAGLFGMIVCRNGADRSAEVTRREQWVIHRKMIIIVNDDDLRQMMSLRTSDTDPSDLLRQKLEEFRLAF